MQELLDRTAQSIARMPGTAVRGPGISRSPAGEDNFPGPTALTLLSSMRPPAETLKDFSLPTRGSIPIRHHPCAMGYPDPDLDDGSVSDRMR